MKDKPIKRKTPDIKQPDHHHVYPTLDMRQASILFQCVRMGMSEGIFVDGVWVSADEWKELIRALWR